MTEVALTAPADEAGVVVTAETPVEVSANDELGSIWDKHERDNGAGRDGSGRFASQRSADANNEVDGADAQAGEETAQEAAPEAEAQAVKSSVPMPPTFTGMDDVWGKIPPEAQEAILANQQKLHKTLSDMGRAVSTYKPVADVFGEFKEYFGGERGNHKPDDAVRHLFNLQRKMDDNPIQTLMEIADTYQLRHKLQEMFTGQPGTQTDHQDYTQTLLAKIDGLERHIQQISDPSRMDERISHRLTEERTITEASDVISRSQKDMPLFNDVEPDLPLFIERSWGKLGASADKAEVLKLAYDMAVNADPDLRRKAAALTSAAQPDAKRVADARKANETNIRSTSSGKPIARSEEDELAAIWDKHKR